MNALPGEPPQAHRIFALVSYSDEYLKPGMSCHLELSLKMTYCDRGRLRSPGPRLFQSGLPSARALLRLDRPLEPVPNPKVKAQIFDATLKEWPRTIRVYADEGLRALWEDEREFMGYLHVLAFAKPQGDTVPGRVIETYMRSSLEDETFGAWMPTTGRNLRDFSPQDHWDDEMAQFEIE